MTYSKVFYTLFLFAAVLLLTSCASSKRMMRISPFNNDFYKGKQTPEATMAGDRKNYWPLYYENFDNTSCMWPVMDIDSHGIAVRPFFNQDDNEYSVLFPLIAWNPEEGDGWVLTAFWNKQKEKYGCFPLFRISNKHFNYILPVWWNKDTFGILTSCFSDKLNFIGPFWYNKSPRHGIYGGLFPLIQAGHATRNWFVPLYFYEKGKHSTLHNVMFNILARFKTFDNGDCEYWVFPFVYAKKNETKGYFLFPFFYFSSDKTTNQFSRFIFPWFQSRKGNEGFDAVIPFFVHYSGKYRSGFISPLFSYGYKNHNLAFWNLLGPLYTYSKADNSESHNILFPIFRYDSPNNHFSIFPLINYYIDDIPAFINIRDNYFSFLGELLFKYQKSPTLSWFRSINFIKKTEAWKAYEQKDNDDSYQSQTIHALLLFWYSHKYYKTFLPRLNCEVKNSFKHNKTYCSSADLVEKTTYNLSFFNKTNKKYIIWNEDKLTSEEVDVLQPLIYKLNNISYEKSRLKYAKRDDDDKKLKELAEKEKKFTNKLCCFLKQKGVMEGTSQTTDSIARGLIKLKQECTEKVNLNSCYIPFLFHYESLEEDFRWDLLYFLVQKERIDDYKQFNILKYLYMREQKGKQIKRNIFPFIQYDSAPSHSKFSFLYRLFNYENRDGHINGHIFFIPF